jgi:hypothetical protein
MLPERRVNTGATRMPQTNTPSFGQFEPRFSPHWQRCKQLPPLRPGEAEALTAAFLADRGITACPPRYVEAVEQRPQFVALRRI